MYTMATGQLYNSNISAHVQIIVAEHCPPPTPHAINNRNYDELLLSAVLDRRIELVHVSQSTIETPFRLLRE